VVVGIDASDIVVGLGTFHCLTQQIPYVWCYKNMLWVRNSNINKTSKKLLSGC
jgi:hypothetical protein